MINIFIYLMAFVAVTKNQQQLLSAKISKIDDKTQRIEEIRRLSESVSKWRWLLVYDERFVDNICVLLKDDSDSVVFWADVTLGKLGASATKALPLLKEKLKMNQETIGSLTSSNAIRASIKRIEKK